MCCLQVSGSEAVVVHCDMGGGACVQELSWTVRCRIQSVIASPNIRSYVCRLMHPSCD